MGVMCPGFVAAIWSLALSVPSSAPKSRDVLRAVSRRVRVGYVRRQHLLPELRDAQYLVEGLETPCRPSPLCLLDCSYRAFIINKRASFRRAYHVDFKGNFPHPVASLADSSSKYRQRGGFQEKFSPYSASLLRIVRTVTPSFLGRERLVAVAVLKRAHDDLFFDLAEAAAVLGWRPGRSPPPVSTMKSSASMMPEWFRSTARWMAFSSSRTLPRHWRA